MVEEVGEESGVEDTVADVVAGLSAGGQRIAAYLLGDVDGRGLLGRSWEDVAADLGVLVDAVADVVGLLREVLGPCFAATDLADALSILVQRLPDSADVPPLVPPSRAMKVPSGTPGSFSSRGSSQATSSFTRWNCQPSTLYGSPSPSGPPAVARVMRSSSSR